MTGAIHVDSGGPGVRVLTLDNPPMNPLGEALRARLMEVLAEAGADPAVRAILITGKGKAFCAGDDLKQDKAATGGSAGFGRLLERLDDLKIPLIGAINGWCIGGGFEVALCCDIRIASHEARFISAGVNMGLMTSAWRLPRLIGEARAKAMLLTGSPIDAETAERYGLVTGLYGPEDLLPAALKLAHRIASRAPLSVEAAKETAGRAMAMTRAEAVEFQAPLLERLRASDDHREAVTAFREKRDPVFKRR